MIYDDDITYQFDRVMRTIIELPDEQIQRLASLGERERLSRAELVRRAVAEFLDRHKTGNLEQAFGIWKNRATDGLRYQERIRDEWER